MSRANIAATAKEGSLFALASRMQCRPPTDGFYGPKPGLRRLDAVATRQAESGGTPRMRFAPRLIEGAKIDPDKVC